MDFKIAGHAEMLAELDRLRSELATKDARIARLEAAGSRLGDAAIDGILTGMENVSEERADNEALRKELAETKSQLGSARKQLETIWAVVSGINPATVGGMEDLSDDDLRIGDVLVRNFRRSQPL